MSSIDGIKPNGTNDLIINAMRLVYSYIVSRYATNDVADICDELKAIARIEDFDFNAGRRKDSGYTYTQIQEMLSKINEKESIRKSKGVYYTPNDVVRFILTNSIKSSFGKLKDENITDMDLSGIPYHSFCVTKTVFDPTCGAGEYLLTALETKLKLFKQNQKRVTDTDVKHIVSSIYGNDVNLDSVIIAEMRLLLCVLEICGVKFCRGLGNMMNHRFTTYDFVQEKFQADVKFHIIVGNPPYVEDSKSGLSPENKYGNIYANVLINAAERLEKNGAMGFIIPLSYVSTLRMKQLREELGRLFQNSTF